MTVMVVEDDDDIRVVVSEILGVAGYNVVESANGKEALCKLKNIKAQVILLDMRMPVMDGWEFARQYHKEYNSDANIVVMTAAQDAAQRAREINAYGVLPKPFGMGELLSVVKSALPS